MWAFYPESNQRTLEEMDLLFVSLPALERMMKYPQLTPKAAPVPWTWTAEANFKRLKAEHPELAHDASVARVRNKSFSAMQEEGQVKQSLKVEQLLQEGKL